MSQPLHAVNLSNLTRPPPPALRVLVVEDSAIVRTWLNDLLATLPGVALVGEAGDVSSAIGAADRLQYDVVILDIRMPGGSGLDVLRHIKQHRPGTVVIMFTNLTEQHYRRACLEAGADLYFDKSLEFHALTEVLRTMAEHRL